MVGVIRGVSRQKAFCAICSRNYSSSNDEFVDLIKQLGSVYRQPSPTRDAKLQVEVPRPKPNRNTDFAVPVSPLVKFSTVDALASILSPVHHDQSILLSNQSEIKWDKLQFRSPHSALIYFTKSGAVSRTDPIPKRATFDDMGDESAKPISGCSQKMTEMIQKAFLSPTCSKAELTELLENLLKITKYSNVVSMTKRCEVALFLLQSLPEKKSKYTKEVIETIAEFVESQEDLIKHVIPRLCRMEATFASPEGCAILAEMLKGRSLMPLSVYATQMLARGLAERKANPDYTELIRQCLISVAAKNRMPEFGVVETYLQRALTPEVLANKDEALRLLSPFSRVFNSTLNARLLRKMLPLMNSMQDIHFLLNVLFDQGNRSHDVRKSTATHVLKECHHEILSRIFDFELDPKLLHLQAASFTSVLTRLQYIMNSDFDAKANTQILYIFSKLQSTFAVQKYLKKMTPSSEVVRNVITVFGDPSGIPFVPGYEKSVQEAYLKYLNESSHI
ncbi:unnamed protein product [Kuraishia capsulata CBS 1993]|uniref:Uncharacterized protein n=1 Tax=Kuraishia capsulata CBS 1993 TaxID=1382522 RepID=W6MNP7_9ASCO|nr:uncharacterized protein KUCA_T00003883001 [Kuraishia capsulata CBS 1993]CDK27903.1 unnamed protein product [Kuraishia capsulata CBS 1993]